MWRIYYADGTVEGEDAADWVAAPDTGVQVVVDFSPPYPVRWHCSAGVVRDRRLWTGDDVYDPFGWGVKDGTLIEADLYLSIWESACTDPPPEG